MSFYYCSTWNDCAIQHSDLKPLVLRRSNHLSKTAKTAVGAEETPVGEWSVTRVRTAAHGTAHSGTVQILYGIKGLGGASESVARQLVLTKSSLVERRKNNYEVSQYAEVRKCYLVLFSCFCLLFLMCSTIDYLEVHVLNF